MLVLARAEFHDAIHHMMTHAAIPSGMSNSTSQDGTPVTFNLPVDMTTVKAEHFEWGFQDGTKRKAACAIPGGRPAGEPNEQQTVALLGNAGGWGDLKATTMTIVGDLMLISKNGTRVSAKGLSYNGTDSMQCLTGMQSTSRAHIGCNTRPSNGCRGRCIYADVYFKFDNVVCAQFYKQAQRWRTKMGLNYWLRNSNGSPPMERRHTDVGTQTTARSSSRTLRIGCGYCLTAALRSTG